MESLKTDNAMFKDRADAGRRLAAKLQRYQRTPNGLVVGIAYGGIAVAKEIAQILDLPLEALICRKLRAASDHALGLGALAETGLYHLNRVPGAESLDARHLRDQLDWTRRRIAMEQAALRGGRGFPPIEGSLVILVDDGVVTGATIMAAAKAVRQLKPARLIVAVPAGPFESLSELAAHADDCAYLESPREFGQLRDYYADWRPLTAEETISALAGSSRKGVSRP